MLAVDASGRRTDTVAPPTNLVTGAGGFVGRALVMRLLELGESVRALLRRPTTLLPSHAKLQVMIGDLGDPQLVADAVSGVTRVFHLGATTKGSAQEFQNGTVRGTQHVLDACRRHATARLVYLSSMSVIDVAGNDTALPLTETARLEPFAQRRGLYTQSKLQAEKMVALAIAAGSVRAVVLRPGQIFGPGAERVAPNGVIALAGRWIVVGAGRLALPLVYLDDVVDAIVAAGERDQALGHTIHLVDTDKISQREYLQALQRLGAVVPNVSYCPKGLVLLLAAGVEVASRALRRDLPLSRYRVESLRPLSNFNVSKASQLLGWRPRVGVRAGLARMTTQLGTCS